MLSILLLTPLIGMLVLLCVPASRPALVKTIANLAGLASVVACLAALPSFQAARGLLREELPWIPSIGASYLLVMDGYSFLLVLMTAILTALALLSSWNAIESRLKEYYAYFLFLESAMLGVFLAQDLFLFFIFWELTLVPMYLIIGIWGGPRRSYAATKFLLYTLIGSMIMFLGILALYFEHRVQTGVATFSLQQLLSTRLDPGMQWWIFLALFAGFAVKIPMWPFHTWLPDAHVEAPTAGSVILAGVLLKMGTYGFLRFSLPLLPDAARDPKVVSAMGLLSLIAIVYGALVSLMQKDWKKLVAYSSVSHLGFCTLGIFALNPLGLTGSILQQINHGISTSLLFLIVGIVYERQHTRDIAFYGGLFKVMPVYTMFFLIAVLSSMGMPPLNGFVGELTVLQGAYGMSVNWAIWCAVGIALGAAYLLWLFQRVTLGETSERNSLLKDLSLREIAVCSPLLAGIFLIGIYPKPLFDLLQDPVAKMIAPVLQR